MKVYVCDACHYIFKKEDSPDSCPTCKLSSLIGQTDPAKKVTLPAVRLATETEIVAYETVENDTCTHMPFLGRVHDLSLFDLSDDEYHVALMLLFYFKSAQDEYKAKFLNDLLPAKDGFIENRMAQTIGRGLYMEAKNFLIEQIGLERKEVGVNDIANVAAKLPEDSAAGTLLKFRKSPQSKSGNKRTLGDIRRVDIEKVVKEPGPEYQRFLLDWYNSLEK